MTPADRNQFTTPTIMVVEDDLDTRDFIVMLLNMAGYQTVEAASGAAALATIARQTMQGITLDLRLPDMDGLALCRQLRANGHPDLPILLMTADQTPDIERRAQDAGVTAFLAKPFLPETLIDRLELMLRPLATP